jgi:hypothetical protein
MTTYKLTNEYGTWRVRPIEYHERRGEDFNRLARIADYLNKRAKR